MMKAAGHHAVDIAIAGRRNMGLFLTPAWFQSISYSVPSYVNVHI